MGGGGEESCWKQTCSHELSGLLPEREGNHKPSGTFDAIDNSATLSFQTLGISFTFGRADLELFYAFRQANKSATY